MLYGTVTFDTPRKISQLAQTPPGLSGRWLPPVPLYMLGYTTVYPGLPLVNLLQTKTMAVKIAGISIPMAALIWVMIYQMMIKVDFKSIREAGKNPKGLFITWITNWLINLFTMNGIASFFLFVIFKGVHCT